MDDRRTVRSPLLPQARLCFLVSLLLFTLALVPRSIPGTLFGQPIGIYKHIPVDWRDDALLSFHFRQF